MLRAQTPRSPAPKGLPLLGQALDKAVAQLGNEVRENDKYHGPDEFEKRVFEVLQAVAKGEPIEIKPTFHPHAFPDIRANGFGVEVKTTGKDTWQSVGNSVFEGMRDPDVTQIYVVFGKRAECLP